MTTKIPKITETIEPYSVTPVLNSETFPEDIDTYNTEQPSRLASKNIVVAQTNTAIEAINIVSAEIEANAETSTTKAAETLISADEAQASAIASENSRQAAEVIFDTFDDKWLGSFETEPTLDNDGDPLQDGAIYVKIIAGEPNEMYVFDADDEVWVNMNFVPTNHASLTNRDVAGSHPISAITNLQKTLDTTKNFIPVSKQLSGEFTINGTALEITNLYLAFSNGISTQGVINTSEDLGDVTVPAEFFAGLADGTYWLKKKEGGDFVAMPNEPIYQPTERTERTEAGYQTEIFEKGRFYTSTDGAEKVVNGTFDTDLSDWTVVTPIVNWNSNLGGVARMGAGSFFRSASAFPVTNGRVYKVLFSMPTTVGLGTIIATVYHSDSTSSGSYISSTAFPYVTGGSKSASVTAEEDFMFIGHALSNFTQAELDNISIYETEILPETLLPAQTYLDTKVVVVDGTPVSLEEWTAPHIAVDKIISTKKGRTWVTNLAAFKSFDQDYTNNTDYEMEVAVRCNTVSVYSALTAFIDGSPIKEASFGSDLGGQGGFSFTVPARAKYRIHPYNNPSVISWSELTQL